MKVVVTGGASGVGKAITRRLAQEPSDFVYFTFNSSQESAAEIEREFSNTRAFRLDFNSLESIDSFVRQLPGLAPDVLVNNAITGYSEAHFHKMDPAVFEKSFRSNVCPIIRITQQFIVESRKRKSGRIITILSSALINRPPVGWSEYTANKAYLHSMVKSWAVENAAFGITSNSISPSFMQTRLTSKTDSRLVESMIADNPNTRLLSEGEVTDVVMFFMKSTSHLNGHNLVINAARDV